MQYGSHIHNAGPSFQFQWCPCTCVITVECILFLYFQLKPVSTPGVPAAAVGSASTSSTDKYPFIGTSMLCWICWLYCSWRCWGRGIGGVSWADSLWIYQEVPEGQRGHWGDSKSLEDLVLVPLDEGIFEGDQPSLWRSSQDQSYHMIMQHIDQSATPKQSAEGHPLQKYVLSYVPTAGLLSQTSQVCAVVGVKSPVTSVAKIWIITMKDPTNLSQYSLTDLGNVSFNPSGGATALSVTPITPLLCLLSQLPY